ncbi:BTB domain-containing protein [Mycena indigotica]|uniref:BTB domain-containing protein n=1 Tax=Mycena indigotica TaxID=2126181 RepID=A0A8H6VYZ0_9AGAR|nr:BTB domain-containing protein [Mycena indigotica]KAF7299324.1 BTB domain-containing protein [Mycena indigotica]
MSSAPPAKRRRTESEDEGDQPVIVRSTEYWFDDGNVILQVQSTQFRLTRSFLAMHSPVFRDMFSLPLPPDEPLVEGCPVVDLPGDTSQDWTYLLRAMFPQECYNPARPLVAPICAILRLSKKYDMAGLRRHCLGLLKMEFPTSLEDFDKQTLVWTHFSIPDTVTTTVACVEIINLARELGLYSILPGAFYKLLDDEGHKGLLGDDLAKLNDKQDEVACLKAYVKMSQTFADGPFSWLGAQSSISWAGCATASRCASFRNSILIQVLLDHDLVAMQLQPWASGAWDNTQCASCLSKAKASFDAARKDVWEKLPSYFGLEDWATLRKMDFE